MSNSLKFFDLLFKTKSLVLESTITKKGRLSPYYFNSGLICNGEDLELLCSMYADMILEQELKFDVIFGSAYKGIPIAVLVSTILSKRGCKCSFAFDRKMRKDHGEYGNIVGDKLEGKRVIIIDDVISSGKSISIAHNIINTYTSEISSVFVALDRMEQSFDKLMTAKDRIVEKYNMQTHCIANINDLIYHLHKLGTYEDDIKAIEEYKRMYSGEISTALA